MKITLNLAAAMVCGLLSTGAAFAEQHIDDFILNVPIKFVGNARKVDTGLWVSCTVFRQAGGAHRQIHQDYILAHPGDLISPPQDGTHHIAFPWTIPPDMKNSSKWGNAPYNWNCRMYKGSLQQNLSTATSYVENGDPVSPATFGTCAYIKGQLNADFTESTRGTPLCTSGQ